MCTGPSTVCGILSNGSVACWGNNEEGALGSGLSYSVLSTSASPRLVPNIGSATAISCGALFNCALDSGKAYCWGTTTTGQLGNGTTGSVGSPVPVQVLTNATNIAAISTGVNHACLIDSAFQY
ncbi:cell wall surface anchor family protein [Acanthamoeba castellanii str. Neff]|uniref:Cell wall surface anchor family protein n=1 Tax=Acanthamoeba castellanii (strain ATCC 30010 / Neff) TaxID=1257118 RepID=L8HBM1_ACACF|nr:cell wall surface anchor family protein [Acanthamoeba castellanii str. Neff]ELR21811.1 cell wall surface anchor family protein [Acanthamoeba castellanii str. Neff]